MLISIHIPRTAGTSFRFLLKQYYGQSVLFDYGDPIMVNNLIRTGFARKSKIKNRIFKSDFNNKRCIHGHFLPYKYLDFKKEESAFVVWIREPMDRLMSHYSFIIKENKKHPDVSPFHQKVIKEKWNFEKFCLDKTAQNLYSKFFWNFPISKLNFIGSLEDYDHDINLFCNKYFDHLDQELITSNKTLKKPSYSPNLLAMVKEFHKEDYILYGKLMKRRNEIVEKFIKEN